MLIVKVFGVNLPFASQRLLLLLLGLSCIGESVAKPAAIATLEIISTDFEETTSISTTTMPPISTTTTTTTATTTATTTMATTATPMSTSTTATAPLLATSSPTPDVKVTEMPEALEIVENVNAIDNDFRAKYGQLMLTYMNRSVDPCEDFYEYACGNWKNVIKVRQAQHKRSNLIDIVYSLNDVVEELLLRPISDDFEFANEFKLTQQFYESCLTAQLYPMQKSATYLEVIKSIGGFPAVDETWRADNFSWFNTSAHLTNYGASGLIREKIIPQYPFPPYFKLPELGFDYIVHSDNIASNGSHELNENRMRNYLKLYGVVDESKLNKTVEDIVDFWRAVLNISDEFDEDPGKCELIWANLDEDNFTQWNNYMEISWGGISFDLDEEFWPCDYFYKELDKVCNERKEAVANYLALKFIYHMDARLDDVKFQKEYCTLQIQRSLPYIIDRMYTQEYFNTEIRKEIMAIVTEVRKSLRATLEEADWLDDHTRQEALEKESAIALNIGSYEDYAITDLLIKEMKNLTFVENNFEQNMLNLKKFKTYIKRYNGLHYKELENTTKPLELLLAMQVNSFYYNVDNSIYVMAGILHPPGYHKAWPDALKFGTIGFLVGHEFTHGFDSVGSHYDSVGDERYWWSNKSGQVFSEREKCYVDQYNNYTIPEINRHIDGNVTKDENIADSGGLRAAFSAYQRYRKEMTMAHNNKFNPKDEVLPGVDLTPEQLYFIGFAHLWCASYKEEHYWEELTNPHTMDKYRVLGAVTNIEDFSKAYNCPLGSKMNPTAEKCRVW